jgi:hypothetical protein
VAAAARPAGARNEAGGLWHDVPRLDRSSRLWVVPADKAAWVAGGLAPAALAVNLDWRLAVDPHVGLLALAGLLAGLAGACWQPERRSLPRWALAWLAFHGTPRRATWQPGRSPLAY